MAESHQAHLFAPKHDHSAPDVLIEVAEKAHGAFDTLHSVADHINKSAKFYYGEQAFRKYHWLKGLPGLNKAGNLRGMVLDKGARSTFSLTIKYGEKLEKISTVLGVAGWAIELAKSRTYIKNVLHAPGDAATKSQKVCAEVSMATIRALTSGTPAATHMVATALLKGAHRVHAPTSWDTKINHADFWVDSSYKAITNTDNVVHYINTHLVFK